MKTDWQLQTAKNRFSEVVDRAIKEGPQLVTRRGKAAVVVVSVEEYRRLVRPETDLVDFFQNSPLKGMDFDTERLSDLPREVEL